MMKGQKGITLVALVITIIVMLILVGVSITVAMQGGLFDTARDAASNTQKAANEEANLAEGTILYRVNDTVYTTTAEDIANGNYVNAANETVAE